MSGPRTHGLMRIVLTTIGLNGLVVVAWLMLQGMMGPRSMPSYGAWDGAPLVRLDWPWSVRATVDWLVMLTLLGALIATAALRLFGLMGRSGSANNPADEALPASIPHRRCAVDRIDEPGHGLMRNDDGPRSVIGGAAGCARDISRSQAVRVACAGENRPLPDRVHARERVQRRQASRRTVISRTD
jgi:hypothetical protein